ncbi:MAG: C25 family cysteine peptidase [bacterium]
MKNILAVLIVLFVSETFGQDIIKEEVKDNIYTITYLNNVNYKINNDKTIEFENTIADYSKAGSFCYPEKDLFIAIPTNSKPKINFRIIDQLTIDGFPKINPAYVKTSDSTANEELIEFANTNIGLTQNFIVKGYLFIENRYCLHLKINPFFYDRTIGKTIQIKNFSIELGFTNPIIISQSKSAEQNGIILNNYFEENKFIYKSQSTDSWIDYGKEYLKIGVNKDNIYRIDKQDLIEKQINPAAIDPKTFKMFCRGEQIPIYVSGEDDFSFDTSDYIEFVGTRNTEPNYREIALANTPYKEYLNRYTDTTAYWLTWDGDYGLRVDTTINYSSIPVDTLNYYDEFLHFEKDVWYDFSLSGGDIRREDPNILENETWIYGSYGVGTQTQNFTVTNLFPNKQVKIFAKLMNYASSLAEKANLIALKINNYDTPYDSSYMNKYEQKIYKGIFNSSLLVNGTNKLKVISYVTQSTVNSYAFDWREIEYPRYIKAINDTLSFGYRSLDSPVFAYLNLTNVTTNNFVLYKYYKNGKNIKITNYSKNDNIITFIDTVNHGDLYILKTPSTIKKPIFYYKKTFENLRNTENTASYLIITHPKLIDNARNYANFVSNSYNVNTKVINVFDIYDEFNYGFFAPEPIKEFLKTAYYNWQEPKIKNIFIIGRANYDFYGNKVKYASSPVELCFVPSYGTPVSDNWYVIWDTTGANIPQINIGRLPARNNDELLHYFSKHQNYIQQIYDEWNKKYLFFTGGNFNDPNQISTLKAINDNIIESYVKPAPIGGNAVHLYKTINPITNFGPYSSEFIQNRIDEGNVFISYLGHSGTQTWDNSITDPIQLRNIRNRSPLITDFGCSTARFAEPDITSFSELFVNGISGQAIGYVGNSSLGFTSTSYVAPKLFYAKILRDSVYNLGDAHRLSKIDLLTTYGSTGTYRLFSLTNTLVGDPIINLAIPVKPNLIISTKNIKIQGNINDLTDSVLCKIEFYNMGKTVPDSFNIAVNHIYNSQVIKSDTFRISLPLLVDSLSIYFIVKNKPGEHKFEVFLDEKNEISEIYENDNNLLYTFNVTSTTIRNLLTSPVENQINSNLVMLNPIGKPDEDKFIVKLSKEISFNQADSLVFTFDRLFTKVNLSQFSSLDRIWLKSKFKSSGEFGEAVSFYLGDKDKYLLKDSLSFTLGQFNQLSYSNNSLKIDSINFNLYALSAGFNAGRTVIIALNNQNLIPENTLRGYHVCVFDNNSLNLLDVKLFSLANGAAVVSAFIDYLDSLQNDKILVISVSDDGQVGLTAALKNKIKEFGSKYIDQLGFRNSWAMIGYKGAPTGTVPEDLKTAFAGKVEIDTLIKRMPTSGIYTTSTIGPVNNWRSMEVNQSVNEGTDIKYRVLGITEDNSIDTLNYVTINESGVGDLNNIDAIIYSKIKLLLEFTTNPNINSPELKSLSVDYKKLPELAINYQVVSVSSDTVDQGQEVDLNFSFLNAGGSKADSFIVHVNLIKADNTKRILIDSLITQLDTMVFKEFLFNYKTNFNDSYGNMAFEIFLDSQNNVKELYKDNNYFKIPFYVIKDTITNLHSATINTKFDNVDIADGDYVSANPEISIQMDYLSLFPYNDTTAVKFYLDGVRIYRSQLDSSVYDTASRRVVYKITPELSDGEHQIRVSGENIIGNIEETSGYQKSFVVSSEAKILYAYNYPNPFVDDTYFTFKLTQIPDELNIRIYTVAGRLIKKFDIKQSDLTIDFNKIYWDGKDEDGDNIANGIYFYKIIIKKGDKQENITQKLAKVK